MKILHTSDWHLGKIFHEHSLLEDQKYFLQQIIQKLENAQVQTEPYDALVIAGDIYDRAVPPPEAVTLLSEFLTEVNKKFSQLHIFLIAGNHDSPDRLSFAAQILEASKIHIATDASKLDVPVILGEGDDKTAFYSIPFLTPGKLQKDVSTSPLEASLRGDMTSDVTSLETTPIRSQQELLAEACKRILSHKNDNFPNTQTCVIAHSFITSAQIGNSERRFVGDVDSVSADIFSEFTYTALGHIHKVQHFQNNSVCYSGAPLVYAFDDFKNETVMLSVILKEGKLISSEKINFAPLHKVVRLEGNFSDFYGTACDEKIAEENKNNYIEFVLKGLAGIENPIGLLRQKYPFTLSIKRADSVSHGAANQKKAILDSNAKNKSERLFDDFIDDVYDSKRDASASDYAAEKKLFLDLAKNYSI